MPDIHSNAIDAAGQAGCLTPAFIDTLVERDREIQRPEAGAFVWRHPSRAACAAMWWTWLSTDNVIRRLTSRSRSRSLIVAQSFMVAK